MGAQSVGHDKGLRRVSWRDWDAEECRIGIRNAVKAEKRNVIRKSHGLDSSPMVMTCGSLSLSIF